MLMEEMSPAEVTKEIISDWQELCREDGTIARLGRNYDQMRRKLKIQPSNNFIKATPIKTHKKNNWLLFLSKAPSITKYKGIESINILGITYYFTNIGLRAFKIIPDPNGGGGINGLSVFNSHLFTRYAERLSLNISDPINLMQHFFTKNGYFSMTKVQETGMIATCSEGMLLGEIQNSGGWIVLKTFINDQQKRSNQTREEIELMNYMQREIEEELNKEQFDKAKYDYFADTLLGVKKIVPKSK